MTSRSTNTGAGHAHVVKVTGRDIEMGAFDLLPPALRQALDRAPENFSAAQALQILRSGTMTEDQLRRAILGI